MKEGRILCSRYKLTPLFWGLATTAVLGLSATAVVLLGLKTSLGAQLFDGIRDLKATITPKGHCAPLQEPPWQGYFAPNMFISKTGHTSMLDVATEMQAGTNERRSRSLAASSTAASLCPFVSEAECNTPNLAPYRVLASTLAEIDFGGSTNKPSEFTCRQVISAVIAVSSEVLNMVCKKTIIPWTASYYGYDERSQWSLDLCYSTNALNPCTAEQTVQFDKVIRLLKDSYPYPCKWQHETLGSFLSARSPFQYSLSQNRDE